MEDQLISFETAKLAKEKGFIEKCNFYYHINKEELFKFENCNLKPFSGNIPGNEDWQCSAPTQSLLQKWLREKYNLHIGISVNQFGYGFMFSIIDIKDCKCIQNLTGGPNHKFNYEEALEKGLQNALLLI